MYSEYTVGIFRFLNLFLHYSRCFSPAVYLTALFWRVKILVVFALVLCPHATIQYEKDISSRNTTFFFCLDQVFWIVY
jgi:hypothetical protein